MRYWSYLTPLLLLMLAGCHARPTATITDRVVLFVPGVAGDGPVYDGLVDELATVAPVRIFSWGRRGPMMFANFSDRSVHDKAERELADFVDGLPPRVVKITLVGHSAGCGVILGAVAKTRRPIDRIVLLAPSVSPGYDVRAATKDTSVTHVFYSGRDTLFLRWRTSNFGGYDRIKTPAAGFGGFTNVVQEKRLEEPTSVFVSKPGPDHTIIQHPYNTAWQTLGHDGGHFGCVEGSFVEEVILPLLRQHDDPR